MPRMLRAKNGTFTAATAISALNSPGPKAATIASAKQDVGKGHQHIDTAHDDVVGAPAVNSPR